MAMNKKKRGWFFPAGTLLLALLMVFGVACLPGCAPEDAPETGTTAGTEPVPEEVNDFIYATGFEETDSEKFTVGDFGLDPSAATASTKYADWSLVAPYDGEHGSVQIKKLNDNQVLSLSNSGKKEEFNNSIRLRRDGFENLDEVWVSYKAAFSSRSVAASFPAPGGAAWATCFGVNSTGWVCAKTEGKWRGLTYADMSGVPVEAMKWYTVEVHYAKGESTATVEVYIDGQLTRAAACDAFNGQITGLLLEISALGIGECELFVDNLTVSAQRLDSIREPASLIEIEEVTDVTITKVDMTAADGKADTYTMAVGMQGVVAAEVAPANADYQTIRWTSGDPRVATVNSSGKVLALSPGTTVITAASAEPGSTVCDTITVVVAEPAVMKTIPVASVEELKAALAEVASINAADGMTGNIEIVLAGGNYYLTETLKLGVEHSGNNGYHVIIKAAENAEPVLSGASVVTGSWTKEAAGYYSIQVSKDFNSRQLFVNNARAIRARSEDGLAGCKFITDAAGKSIGITGQYPELASYRYPEDLELVFLQEWTQPRAGVDHIVDNGDGTVDLIMDQPGWGYVTNKGGTSVGNKGPAWYENALELLDEPGEWYLDTHTGEEYNILYYMPRPWEDLATAYVTMPTLDNSVDIEGADGALVAVSGTFADDKHNEVTAQVMNIHFEGITFADTTWMRPSAGYGVSDAQNNHIREHGDVLAPGAVVVEAADSIWFTGCTFTRLGINALQMINGVQNSLIIGNHFYDISGSAINIGEPDTEAANANAQGLNAMVNNDVLNNYIHNIGVDYGSSAAISVGFAADVDMTHNEIFDIPYSAWHIGYGWNNIFPCNTKNMLLEYNFIHDIMGKGIYDGGAVYTIGNTSGEGYNYVQRNYFRNQMNSFGVLYADQGTTWFKFVENVIDLSESPAWHSGTPKWNHVNKAGGHVHYINNFSTTSSPTETSTTSTDEGISIEIPKVSMDAGWTDPIALDVVANAGLESAYRDLRKGQVERLEVQVDGAVYDGVEKELKVGASAQLSFTASAIRGGKIVTEGLDYKYYYASQDPAVAEVDENGLVVAKSVGNTTIRVWIVSNNMVKMEKIAVEVKDTAAK